MPDSLDGLLVALLLMPGCFGYFSFTRFYNSKISENFEKVVCVVILNVLPIFVYGLLWNVSEIAVPLKSVADFPKAVKAAIGAIAILSVISIVFGILLACIANSRHISAAALRIGFTARGHQTAVLSAVILDNPASFFKFRFKSGGYVIGHPKFYSLQGNECCIFLEKAARRPAKSDGNGQSAEYPVADGILILNFDEVTCVELL